MGFVALKQHSKVRDAMALEGTFHDMSLIDLFEIFRMGNKSGILHVTSHGQDSTMYVTKGRLIDAVIHDAHTQQLVLRGDAAVVQVLQWDTGEFIFTHDPSMLRRPITIFQAVEQL